MNNTNSTKTSKKKNGGELRCSGRISSSSSTSDIRRVTLVTNRVIKSWMRKGLRSVYDRSVAQIHAVSFSIHIILVKKIKKTDEKDRMHFIFYTWWCVEDLNMIITFQDNIDSIRYSDCITIFTGARGTDHPPFSNFLFKIYFQ